MNKSKLFKELYYQLLRIRLIEERIAVEYAKQEMRCPIHFAIGHEAIPVGVCANLKKGDIVFSNHRSHGHFLAKGGSLPAMVAEIYGKSDGCCKGRGGSQHLIDQEVNFLGATPIVGGTIPVAVGSAFASKMKNDGKITAVFFGDAATEEGVFHESLNYASLMKLPVLFICENNQYSIFTHIKDREPPRDIAVIAKSHGLYTIKGDGNNLLEIYKSSKKAIKNIRAGNGPAFCEYATYRFREHCGPNFEDESGRPKNEVESWIKKCPVKQAEETLLTNRIVSLKDIDFMKKKIASEIDDAFVFASESEFGSEKTSDDLAYFQ